MSITLNIELLPTHNVMPPDENEGIQALYNGALENLELSLADYLTIRDLLSFPNQQGKEAHALLICLFAALVEGSVCLRIKKQDLKRRLSRFLCAPEIDDLAESMIRCLDGG